MAGALTPLHVVVLSSRTAAEGGRDAAASLLDDITAAGYQPLLFQSDGYSSMRCCYWVAAAGPFADVEAARAAAAVLRARSPLFSTAYDRCVGTVSECG